jgi:hypothetical protein
MRIATATASAPELTPSLLKTLVTWALTVRSEMCKRMAISLFGAPWASMASTSLSPSESLPDLEVGHLADAKEEGPLDQ